MLSRRDWLKLLGGAVGGLVILRDATGCGYYFAESGEAYSPWAFPGSESLPERVAARAAILAASPYDSQPWALHVTPSQIDLHADLKRGLGTIDSLQRELHIGLGCALENMVIAAGARGRATVVELLPAPATPTLVATVALAPAPPTNDPLFDQIARRHTNRGRYSDGPAAAHLLSTLGELVTERGIKLRLLTSDADKARARASTIEATTAFIADAEMSRDSNAWWRQTADDILTHRDGLTIDCTVERGTTVFLGKTTGRPSEATAHRYWLDATRGHQSTASAFGILSSPMNNGRDDQLRVGRCYQRMHLWAASQAMAMQPLNQLPEMQDREETTGAAPRFTTLLNDLLAIPGQRAQMLFRIGYPWSQPKQSPRRPLEWILA